MIEFLIFVIVCILFVMLSLRAWIELRYHGNAPAEMYNIERVAAVVLSFITVPVWGLKLLIKWLFTKQ